MILRFRLRYDNAMKSEAHTNFENLLRAVVSVPHDELKRRMEDEKAARDWAKENRQPNRRSRPIVSPAAVSETKRHHA